MSDLSGDEEEHVEMMMKSRVHHDDTESAATSLGVEEHDEHDEGRNITSLYLQRQESDPEADKFRKYMQNKDIFRNKTRRQIFKRTEKEGAVQVDYTRFSKRLCKVGIPTEKNDQICGCGRDITNHCHETYRNEKEDRGTWTFREHTALSVTDAYGKVSFSSDRKAKYIRVESDTPVKEIFELLTNVYNLQTPGVILSVVGSLLGFTVSPKIEKIIQRGMIKAAITTNGWITTAGYNAGHVISVGDALRKHNHSVPCIGFPSWGCLPDKVQETLKVKEQSKKKGVYECKYPKMEIEPGSSRENLNSNHSHFIISDTGAVTDWGSESFMRTSLEAYLKNVMHIPVVQVVIQGGLGVARHLHEAVKSGTTSVIVYGSGGVCDVLVDLIRHHDSLESMPDKQLHSFSIKLQNKGMGRRKSSVSSVEETRATCTCKASEGFSMSCPDVNKIMDAAGLTTEARQSVNFQRRIKEMVTIYREFLILFDMEDEHYDGLDTALLEALVKAQNMADEDTNTGNIQLSGVQVALGWNRPDFAEKLLNSDTATKDEKALGSILMHALAWNLYDFTELLLAHGASIPMVAANTVLLYGSSNNVEHLRRYVRYHLGGLHDSKIDLGSKSTVDKMINRLAGSRHDFDSNVSNESDPYFELMVWATLSLYPQVAELMWSNTQEPIKAALFVLIILRKLHKSKKVIVTNHERETIQSMSRRFEQLAIDIMDLLHQNCDGELREKALKSGWDRLDNMSYIDMAYECKAKDFVAHPACQELQDKRWKRGMRSEVGLLTTVLVFLCPLLVMTPLVTFKRSWVYKGSSNGFFNKWARKFKAFCTSPCVKFWWEVAMYGIFIAYQSFVILARVGKEDEYNCQLNTEKIILIIWFGMLLIDEFIQEMEESYLPPPFSIIHFIVGRIIDKKQAKRLQRDQAHQQYNKRSDTVIRSAVVDCLEDYLKSKRQKEGTEIQTLIQNNNRYLKDKVQQLQAYMDTMNYNMQNNFAELRSFINTE
ncbi:hypothetical protein ACHWQZ_G017638 [Mnemiopsis leidyi]